jgi:hypothetical protein
MNIPGRVLFDTNVVNLSLDFGKFIFDGGDLPGDLASALHDDVTALEGIFFTGKRAGWQLAISPITYREIINTRSDFRRADLLRWLNEIWLYWREIFYQEALSDDCADSLVERFVESTPVAVLPDVADRALIAHAIAYKCDGFCTRDQRTILRYQDKLHELRLQFLSPFEWWHKPYAALWG